MKRKKLVIIIILSILFSFLLFVHIYLDYPLPAYEGEIRLPGIQTTVEIYFDDYGVPYIYAENESDLFYAAGYIAARERLFQMTVTAGAVHGRLAELFGAGSLYDDIYLRTWGIPKMANILAENMHPEAKQVAENFCNGINAYIDTEKGNFPVEFKLLGIEPFRWSPATVAGYERMMAHNLTFSWKTEIVLGEVAHMFGKEKLRQLWPQYPPNHPFIVKTSGDMFTILRESLTDHDERIRDLLGMNASHIGSNNWVISGSRTASGNPILANDPHLPYNQPAVWYEMHLKGGRFNVSGMCLAGIPVPVLGNNESCAWGFTNLMVDDVDFFVETVNPDNPNQYLYDGKWLDMNIRQEVITVKGDKKTILTIRETAHGPIISDIHPLLKDGNQAISFRWGGHEISDEIYSILQLNLMKNWDDFTEAAKHFTVPGQNVVYADTAGNIGWRPFAKIPIRKGGHQLIPVPGDSSAWDWKGFVPFNKMPFLYNPPEGIIITANNKVIDNSYPYYISSFWEDPSRAKRIWELLGDKREITVDDVKDTQTDVTSPFARDIARYFVSAFDKHPITDSKVNFAVNTLRGWDGDHSPESSAAVVFNAAFLQLTENLYADEMELMGNNFFESWLRLASMSMKNIRYSLGNGHSTWFDNIKTNDIKEDRDIILRQSLSEAVQDIENLMGSNSANWKWGKIHTLTHRHAVGKKSAILDWLLNLNVGPFPTGGASSTINNGEYRLNDPYDHINGPSFRRIVDFTNLDNTQIIIPTGQSGLPKSPHYADQAPLYHTGKYRTSPFYENTVKSLGYRKLILSPSQTSNTAKNDEKKLH